MTRTLKDMLAAAHQAVPRVSPAEVKAMLAEGEVLLLDVRDTAELAATGRVQGAHHVPRGMLEFRADPEAPSHDKAFRKERPVVVYCASGGRSALAGKLLAEMGYAKVFNLGAFKDWVDSGGAVER